LDAEHYQRVPVISSSFTPFSHRSGVRFDYAATKTHAIIVPACGLDSVPSDITAYLSALTLRRLSSPLPAALSASWVDVNTSATTHSANVNIDSSTTALRLKGGISGGTLSTVVTILEQVPFQSRLEASEDYSLCSGTFLRFLDPSSALGLIADRNSTSQRPTTPLSETPLQTTICRARNHRWFLPYVSSRQGSRTTDLEFVGGCS
jgi:hypothetical protein